MRNDAASLIVIVMTALVSACSGVKASKPETSPDGLRLVHNTEFSTVYKKPDTDLSAYKKFGVTECFVAFQDNWLRDQNTKRLNRSNRVSQEVADEIASALGDECKAAFTSALDRPPAHEIVESFNVGEKVLVLRPNIINLNINAPNIRSANHQDNYIRSFGEMTLFLELLDGSTQEVLMRIMERRKDSYDTTMWWSNSVATKVSSERILKRWATQLRGDLDQALNSSH